MVAGAEPQDRSGDEAGRSVAANDLSKTSVSREIESTVERTRYSSVPLKSLSPQYEEALHKTYLDRLEQSIRDSRNRNIALTGRYGAGKSSVLDRFEANHKGATLRLAISTLEPNQEGATLTNRLQKEIVKQLLYSASPSTLRHSRFGRISSLSKRKAFGQCAAVVSVLGALLALLGLLPPVMGTGGEQPWGIQASAWLVVGFLVTVILTGIRLATHNKFYVSDVSAAGASVTLSKRTATYFDEFLDEIVHFFDQESNELVIIEDLDRFNDPHIFEALRELNTLLNNAPARAEKGPPLRFIYAVRDSLFEKLGNDADEEQGDAAAAEVIRANRTKFFDLVIPVVPFISYRNARELLNGLLDEANITGIDSRLVDLVAQHATDMRLQVNMRNEYLVFAERLLAPKQSAPGLTPDKLFAVVAYKNFHMEDFEQISRQASDLDRLYAYSRQLVSESIADLEKRKRELLDNRAQAQAMESIAESLGERLRKLAELFHRKSTARHLRVLHYGVANEQFEQDRLETYEFWNAVAHSQAINVVATNPGSGGSQVLSLNKDDLEHFFPEVGAAAEWNDTRAELTYSEVADIEKNIPFLRGADFEGLAGSSRFKIEVDGIGRAFSQVIDRELRSDLARQMVKRGYLDRNFALYTAQFYGRFVGIDVARFMVQHVQANTMDVNYLFSGADDIHNLLQEAGEDFTHSVSAYNIAVLDHLLAKDDPRAVNVVDRMISNHDEQAQKFLTAYLSSAANRLQLAARLSNRGWLDVFSHLVSNDDVPADARPSLVDAALLSADPDTPYQLRQDVADFIVRHYADMSAFTEPQEEERLWVVAVLVKRAGALIPDLNPVDEALRGFLVSRNLYQLTASNLRAALGTKGAVSLDRVCESDTVYQYCLASPDRYLDAIENDSYTPQSVCKPETLMAVLPDVAESWTIDQIEQLVAAAAAESAVDTLADVPPSTWQALAAARLFRASAANLDAYVDEVGEVDENLANLLLHAGAIETDEDETGQELDKIGVATSILGASDTIPDPQDRVSLVRSLHLDGLLPITELTPEGTELFALLLENQLVEDDAAAFLHFRSAGWDALEPAILKSRNFTRILTPDLVEGLIAELFKSPRIEGKLKRQVLKSLDQFVSDSDHNGLMSAANFAVHHRIPLSTEQIHRVAAASQGASNPALALLQIASPPPTPDEIVSTLAQLGAPYSHLTTRAANEFEVSDDDAHRSILQVLREADVCTFKKVRGEPRLVVNLR